MKTRWPRTPEDWQDAYDAALAARGVADMRMYGLVSGGPRIDLKRCYRLIELAEA